MYFARPEDFREREAQRHQQNPRKHQEVQIFVEKNPGKERRDERRERGYGVNARHRHQAQGEEQAVNAHDAG